MKVEVKLCFLRLQGKKRAATLPSQSDLPYCGTYLDGSLHESPSLSTSHPSFIIVHCPQLHSIFKPLHLPTVNGYLFLCPW